MSLDNWSRPIRVEAFVTMHVLEIEFNSEPVFVYEKKDGLISWVDVHITVALIKGLIDAKH
jgi:hypothetical protein